MPLKLNFALSRKIGEPNYGSRGATVGLELEVDSNLIHQPQQLHSRIARLFQLAKASIDAELDGRPAAGEFAANGDSGVRSATVNQIRAIRAIADRQQVDLLEELRGRFHLERPEDLSLAQASELIDAIKPSTNGVADP